MFGDRCELHRIEYRKNENGLYTVYVKGCFGATLPDGQECVETLALHDCEARQLDGEEGVLFSLDGNYVPDHDFDLFDAIGDAVVWQTEEKISEHKASRGAGVLIRKIRRWCKRLLSFNAKTET